MTMKSVTAWFLYLDRLMLSGLYQSVNYLGATKRTGCRRRDGPSSGRRADTANYLLADLDRYIAAHAA